MSEVPRMSGNTKKREFERGERGAVIRPPPLFPLVELGACPISGGGHRTCPPPPPPPPPFSHVMRQDDAKDGEISAAQKKANDFHGVSREKKESGNVHSCCRRKMSKNVKCFLFLKARLARVFLPYFLWCFPLKKVRKWTADMRIFAIVQKRKSACIIEWNRERKTRGIFTALVWRRGEPDQVARKQKGCPHSFGIQKSSQTTSVPDVLAADRFGGGGFPQSRST